MYWGSSNKLDRTKQQWGQVNGGMDSKGRRAAASMMGPPNPSPLPDLTLDHVSVWTSKFARLK